MSKPSTVKEEIDRALRKKGLWVDPEAALDITIAVLAVLVADKVERIEAFHLAKAHVELLRNDGLD